MKQLLKILSGPHVGGEINLNAGKYIIGSGEEADIIISDSTVLPMQVLIDIANDEIQLEVLDGKVYVEDKPINTGEKIHINPRQPITLGTTCFVVLEEDDSWDEIPFFPMDLSSKTMSSETDDISESPTESEGEISVFDDDEEKEEFGDENHDKTLTDTTDEPLHVREETSNAKKGNLRRILAMLLVLAIALVTVALAWSYIRKSMDAAATKQIVLPTSKLENVLKKHGFTNITIEQQDNQILLKGILSTEQQKKKLYEVASKFGVPIVLDVLTDEGILKTVREVLKRVAPELTAESSESGVFTLRGTVASCDILDKAIKIIKEDVVGVKNIISKVTCLDKVATSINETFRSSGFGGVLQTRILKDRVSIQGKIESNEVSKWNKIYTEIHKKFGTIVESSILIIPSKQANDVGSMINAAIKGKTEQYFNIPVALQNIEGVVIGLEERFIVTRSGQKIYQGDELDGKYLICDIEPNYVVVEKNSRKKKIYFRKPSILLKYYW
ncbi:MAG: BON domain-containing protein [Deltaproteobacteria bacterium]|nr:BON domain-containing protein [Deltaproteobacteria bacterium]